MLNLYHKRLKIWHLSLEILHLVYQISRCFPENEKYGLTSQMRRAAISVWSNIAEGSARYSNVEKRRFFEIARSSIVEIDAHFEIGFKLSYISHQSVENFPEKLNKLFAMLCRYIENLSTRTRKSS